ncbi:molybdenum cofactor guanylyltransferase [Pyrococcus abyssi]|nr:molybdenum cofactor guanylyltransferase [Pyrococcus abyssi]CAB49003.1 moaB-1 probable molybdopterin-guanine dinucleotide biosynthesis protein A [Pyrococcus abyssi GE5]
MLGVIFAVKLKRSDNYLIPIDDEPMLKIVERRLRLAKRIEDVITLVRKGYEKKYSLHVSNVKPVKGKNIIDALLEGIPYGGELFLVKGNMPLVMPFLVNYMSTLFLEDEVDALIPRWRDGRIEIFHAIYNARALRNALEAMKAENERDIKRLPEYLDVEYMNIDELVGRNKKVIWSFFEVRTSEDLRTILNARDNLGKI